mmetsp:Transcript_15622/g.30301  ORF Transcript_15622/g.30301 Transcript_15622/m.30301 type:complete len:276 (-) Transcript_15622:3390-4217(-)
MIHRAAAAAAVAAASAPAQKASSAQLLLALPAVRVAILSDYQQLRVVAAVAPIDRADAPARRLTASQAEQLRLPGAELSLPRPLFPRPNAMLGGLPLEAAVARLSTVCSCFQAATVLRCIPQRILPQPPPAPPTVAARLMHATQHSSARLPTIAARLPGSHQHPDVQLLPGFQAQRWHLRKGGAAPPGKPRHAANLTPEYLQQSCPCLTPGQCCHFCHDHGLPLECCTAAVLLNFCLAQGNLDARSCARLLESQLASKVKVAAAAAAAAQVQTVA